MDRELRALSREAAAGDPRAAERYVTELVKAGRLTKTHAALARYLGDERVTCEPAWTPPELPGYQRSPFELVRLHGPVGPTILAHLAVEASARVLHCFEIPCPGDPRPRRALELSLGCLRGEGSRRVCLSAAADVDPSLASAERAASRVRRYALPATAAIQHAARAAAALGSDESVAEAQGRLAVYEASRAHFDPAAGREWILTRLRELLLTPEPFPVPELPPRDAPAT